ncbi:hypothetical protein BDZ45DRAFT_789795, partial [Acephala macrosclerotiorum]
MPPVRDLLLGVSCLQLNGATRYTYKFLERLEIRVLKLFPGQKGHTLECELLHTSLETAPPYSALSYVWGEIKPDQRIRVKRGHWSWNELLVTPHLLVALKRLRRPSEPCYLWVDQLCIDQSNKEERSWQVEFMKEIYAKAEKTIVWFGNDDADTQLLEEMLRRISSGASD